VAKSKQSKPVGSLVEMAQRISPPPSQGGYKAWIDKLPPDQRDMLIELREAFSAGKLKGWTPRSMLEVLVLPAGINPGISLQTFRQWIYQYGK
jgi:hypothetical protein